jgi:hypothetical protein
MNNSVSRNNAPPILSQIKDLNNQQSGGKELKLTSATASEFFGLAEKTGVATRMFGSNSIWGKITASFGFDTTAKLKSKVISELKENLKASIQSDLKLGVSQKTGLTKTVDKMNDNEFNEPLLTPKTVISFVDGKLADLEGQVKKALEPQNTTVNSEVTEQDNKKSEAGLLEMITSFFSGSKTEETLTSNDPVAPAGVNSKNNTKNTPQIKNNKVENPVIINPKSDVVLDETRKIILKRGEGLERVEERAAELHRGAVEFKSLTSALVEKSKKKK